MSRSSFERTRPAVLGILCVLTIGVLSAGAGEHPQRRGRRQAARPVPTARVVSPVYGDRIGTFYPTPAIFVQASYPATNGYAPLGIYGDHNLSVYGPFSSFRTTTAPVATYVRGYDGVVRPAESISTSYPNLPQLAPLAYPTRANDYYAPRIRDNPAYESAIGWLDMN